MACLLARFRVPPRWFSLGGTVVGDVGDGAAVGIRVTAMGLAVLVSSAAVDSLGVETSTVAITGAGIVGKLVAVVAGGELFNFPSSVQDRTKSSAKAVISIGSVTFNRRLNFMQITRLKRNRWNLVIDVSYLIKILVPKGCMSQITSL